MQAVHRVSPIVNGARAVGPTFLTRGAKERLGLVLVALACLWLAIGAVLGWIG